MNHRLLRTAILPVVVVGWIFGWMNAHHILPWATFFNDFGVLISICLASTFFTIKYTTKNNIYIVSLIIITFFSIIIVDLPLVLVGSPYAKESALSFFLVGSIFSILVFWFSTLDLDDFGRLLLFSSGGLVAIAVAQVAVGWIQWLGYVEFVAIDNFWVFQAKGGERAVGNIGQANNFGTICTLGLAGTVVLLPKLRALNGYLALFAFLCVCMASGVVISGSRTNLISYIILFTISLRFLWRGERAVVIVGLICLIVFWIYKPILYHWLTLREGAPARVDFDSNLRFDAWRMFFEYFLQNPFGVGFAGLAKVHFTLAESYPALRGQLFDRSHNIFLDIAVMGGWISLALFILFIFLLLPLMFRGLFAKNPGVVFLLIPLFWHSLLEYPHFYVYFLFLCAMLLGLLLCESKFRSKRESWVRVSSSWGVISKIILATLGLLGALIAIEYVRFEQSYQNLRLSQRLAGGVPDKFLFESKLLPRLSEFSHAANLRLDENIGLGDLERLRMAAEYGVNFGFLEKYVITLNGKDPEDQLSKYYNKYCALYSEIACLRLKNRIFRGE